MRINVLDNAKRNILFGFINTFCVTLCPFITKAAIIRVLGAEYLGLSGLFTSVLSVLTLSELGFGFAITYCMYKPVAENDVDTVNALLKYYRHIYRIIGSTVLGVGILITPIIPKLIAGSYPGDINIYIIYLIFLLNASLSYFLFSYRQSLVIVYQRNDIISRTNIVVTALMTVIQVVVLFTLKSYTVFILVMPVITIVNNLRVAWLTKKAFPQYHCSGKLSDEIKRDLRKRVGGMFITKLCMVARNSLDSVCISFFLGLTPTAQYNNYFFILTGVGGFMSILTESFLGGVGNHVVNKSKEENYNELKRFDFVFLWVMGWATICILCLSQPFMTLWMGKDMLLSQYALVLFTLYFYLLHAGDVKSIYINANGLWWELRFRSIVEALLNVLLNILLARFLGIYGILLATIITVFIFNYIWGAFVLFKKYFTNEKIIGYFIYQSKYFIITLISCVITYFICNMTDEFFNENIIVVLIIRLICCIFIPNLVYLFFYKKNPNFTYLKEIARTILKKKMSTNKIC